VTFFTRHTWVGFIICLVFGLLFAWLTYLVLARTGFTRAEPAQVIALHQWARQQPAWLVLSMRGLSAFGRDGEALMALILAVGWMRQKARRELYMLFFGMLAGEVWFQALSNLIQRGRPDLADPFETLKVPGFPSGHAVTTVLMGWMILALLLPHITSTVKRLLLVLCVLAFTAAVCWSRIFLGLHYPSDIYAGIALGLAWGGLVFPWIDRVFYSPRKAAAPPGVYLRAHDRGKSAPAGKG
jgi:membrane-associated phospholipid phosphatase